MPPPRYPQHRALLGAVVSHYVPDARIHAVILFGSVGRGDWHPNSDLGLDIVIVDGLRVDPDTEIHGFKAAVDVHVEVRFGIGYTGGVRSAEHNRKHLRPRALCGGNLMRNLAH
jgi:hypothetical protein